MTQTLIKDLKENDLFDGLLLVKCQRDATTKNGKPYAALNLTDPSGIIATRLWDTPPEISVHYKAGTVVHVKGKIERYQDENQLRISEIEALPKNDPRADPMYYVPRAPVDLNKVKIFMKQTIAAIHTDAPRYGQILSSILAQYGENFYSQPAAKIVHHDFYGGLAYHTYRMVQAIQALVPAVYPNINRNLIVTAALLHDVGKLHELSGYDATDYTIEGALIGHIAIVDGWIVEAALASGFSLDDRDLQILRHTVLAHHGKYDYGSPVEPITPEAYLLHQIDKTDAGLTAIDTTFNAITDQHDVMAPKTFAIGNRALYKA